jgi:hypothetical protein
MAKALGAMRSTAAMAATALMKSLLTLPPLWFGFVAAAPRERRGHGSAALPGIRLGRAERGAYPTASETKLRLA